MRMLLVVPALALMATMLLLFSSPLFALLPAQALPPEQQRQQQQDGGQLEIKNSDYTFVDSDGMLNIVGVVNNKGTVPLSVTMGLDVQGKTLQEQLYGRVIYPGKGAPFKFQVPQGTEVSGRPYVLEAREVRQPFYDTLVLNYTNMAVGEERVLSGTVRNDGPFAMHNITVYASVHSEDMTNLDSVRSNTIPVLAPGEEAGFVAAPDPAVKANVYYYSCAGIDPDAPISTLPTGDGKFIAYDLTTVAKVSGLRYDNSTDSISFGIKHYNPAGGPAVLKFAQLAKNQTVAVMLDGSAYESAKVAMDGRTVQVDLFIPPGDHEVQVQGVRTIPEFPLAYLGLAAAFAAAVALARQKKTSKKQGSV